MTKGAIVRGWYHLALTKEIDAEELQQRLQSYWSLISTISGLIGGFAYIVSNTDVTFGNNNFLGGSRSDAFGCITITTFLFGVGSMLT